MGGMRNCMGPTDANGCMTADTCVPTGDDCPYYCPYMPPMDCGAGMISCPGHVDHNGCPSQGMQNCPGPMDPMGCMTPDTCVPTDQTCPFYCPYNPPMDCGAGMVSCPGPVDSMGCKAAGNCVMYGEE